MGYTAKKLFPPCLWTNATSNGRLSPGDDATACVVRIRKREPMNLLFGPPRNRDDCDRMMSLFFLQRKASTLYAAVPHLRLRQNISESRLKASLSFERSDVPPIAEIEGVDLVTEGVITINKVIEYAEDALGDNDKNTVNGAFSGTVPRSLRECFLRKPPT